MPLSSISERAFTQEVLESPIPVLVHFWAPWCGLCRLINPLLMRYQAEWADSLKIVGFNADQSLKIANTYRLKNLPTLILFAGGKIRHRIDGFQGKEDLRQALETITLNYAQHSSTLWVQPQDQQSYQKTASKTMFLGEFL